MSPNWAEFCQGLIFLTERKNARLYTRKNHFDYAFCPLLDLYRQRNIHFKESQRSTTKSSISNLTCIEFTPPYQRESLRSCFLRSPRDLFLQSSSHFEENQGSTTTISISLWHWNDKTFSNKMWRFYLQKNWDRIGYRHNELMEVNLTADFLVEKELSLLYKR